MFILNCHGIFFHSEISSLLFCGNIEQKCIQQSKKYINFIFNEQLQAQTPEFWYSNRATTDRQIKTGVSQCGEVDLESDVNHMAIR